MRAITAIFILFYFVSTQTNSQWQWHNSLPQGNTICNIRFIDQNTGYAVGAGGTIIKTEDEGETWTILNSGITDRLLDIFFPTHELGFAVTGQTGSIVSKIIRTYDAGDTWDLVFDDTLGPLRTVCFTNSLRGFSGGDEGFLLKTSDGGSTWTVLTLGLQQDIYEIAFLDEQTGFIIGESSTILKTVNGGDTWYSVSSGLPTDIEFFTISFPTNSIGYLGGRNYWGENYLVKSVDTGETWTIIDETLPSFDDLQFISPDSGIMVLAMSLSRRTFDGGQNWEEIDPMFMSLHVYFTDKQNGYFVYGDEGGCFDLPIISKTTDFGATGHYVTTFITLEELTDIDFPSRFTGFIVGGEPSSGVILKTTDGYHWDKIYQVQNAWNQPDTTFSFGDFINNDLGYVCGYTYHYPSNVECIVWRTSDGGESWEIISTESSLAPNSMCFTSPNAGYISGINLDWGNWKTCVIKTNNGGTSWQELMSDTMGTYSGIAFPTAQTGYIQKKKDDIGYGVEIWKTDDGGSSWNNIYTCDTIYPGPFFFSDQHTGYMIISSFKMLKTIDGGMTWSILPGFNQYTSKLFFLDNETGYSLGGNQIWATTDGGLTWAPDDFISSNYFRDLFFLGRDTGYIIGMNGSILYKPDDVFPVFQNEIPFTASDVLTIYPNPFSKSTNLLYNLVSSSNVIIEIYELSGERIYKTEIMRQPAGNYTRSFNAADLASGIYLCRIKTNEKVETSKMIVVH